MPGVETSMRRMTLPIVLAASLIALPTSSLDRLWSYITLAWTSDSTDEGCGLDPSGRCQPASSDAGCGLDPSGLCQPTPDEGCGLDPDGRPLCAQGS
jgi:hypothetical protein